MKKKRVRTRDPERTKANILQVASKEFANRGLAGARVDSIAAGTRTTKRAIYYYFGGKSKRGEVKDQLFVAVLERAYAQLQAAEDRLQIEQLDPRAAIRKLVEFNFDFYDAQREFIRLEVTANIHKGRHLDHLPAAGSLSAAIVAKTEQVLSRGRDLGIFRGHVDAVDLHWLISALCFFRALNHETFGRIFQVDLTSTKAKARLKAMIVDVVLSHLERGPGAGSTD